MGDLNDPHKRYVHEHYYLTAMGNRGRYQQARSDSLGNPAEKNDDAAPRRRRVKVLMLCLLLFVVLLCSYTCCTHSSILQQFVIQPAAFPLASAALAP